MEDKQGSETNVRLRGVGACERIRPAAYDSEKNNHSWVITSCVCGIPCVLSVLFHVIFFFFYFRLSRHLGSLQWSSMALRHRIVIVRVGVPKDNCRRPFTIVWCSSLPLQPHYYRTPSCSLSRANTCTVCLTLFRVSRSC